MTETTGDERAALEGMLRAYPVDQLVEEVLVAWQELADRNEDLVTSKQRLRVLELDLAERKDAVAPEVAQLRAAEKSIISASKEMAQLPQGGTAIGTGINAHKDFGKVFAAEVSKLTKLNVKTSTNYFKSLSSQESAAQLSSSIKNLSLALTKISNDLRWMNSGPLTGLGEIELEALQPGSSIMPGKVNPVIPEAVAMACADVVGNDVTVSIACQSGNFQLNVMLPVIAYNLLKSISLMSNSMTLLGNKTIKTFKVNKKNIIESLGMNPILVTALNREIGYEKAAHIAKKAYKEKKSIIDVAHEETGVPIARLKVLLDPRKLTKGGV